MPMISRHRNRNRVTRKRVIWMLSGLLLVSGLSSAVHAGSNHGNNKVTALDEVVHHGRSKRSRKLVAYIQDRFHVSAAKAAAIVAEADRQAVRYGLDTEIILAVIAVESTFKEKAVSRVGARGLMQIMPKYHPEKIRRIGGIHALFEPRKNIATGSQILGDYLQLSNGNIRHALLRYNGSLKNPKSRYADKVLKISNEFRRASSLS